MKKFLVIAVAVALVWFLFFRKKTGPTSDQFLAVSATKNPGGGWNPAQFARPT